MAPAPVGNSVIYFGLHTLWPNRFLEGGLCETVARSTAKTIPLLLVPNPVRERDRVGRTFETD